MKVVLKASCLLLLTPIALLVALPVPLAHAAPAPAAPNSLKPQLPPIRPLVTCPAELEPMTQALLHDLPQYLNRVSHQIAGSRASRYAIAASRPDFVPLPVVTSTPNPKAGGLYQVFFTVLERQYETQQKGDYQTYHWLFLAHTETTGWQLAILYSRDGDYLSRTPEPSPLRDTTQEAIGRAIRLWLRDCQAGAVQLQT